MTADQRRHAVADVSGVDAATLDNVMFLQAALVVECQAHGLIVLHVVSHEFEPQGVSVVVLLAESHASVHTWPELGEAYVDVFSCGDADPVAVVSAIVRRLGGVVERLFLV